MVEALVFFGLTDLTVGVAFGFGSAKKKLVRPSRPVRVSSVYSMLAYTSRGCYNKLVIEFKACHFADFYICQVCRQ